MSLFQRMKRKQRGVPLKRCYARRFSSVDSSILRSGAAVTPVDEFDTDLLETEDRDANYSEHLEEAEGESLPSGENFDQEVQEDEDLVSEGSIDEREGSLMLVSNLSYGFVEVHEDVWKDQEKSHHDEKIVEDSATTRYGSASNWKEAAKTSAFLLTVAAFIFVGKVPTVFFTLAMAVGFKLYTRSVKGKSDGSESSREATHGNSLQKFEENDSVSTQVCDLSPDLEALQLETGRQLRRLNCMRILPDSPILVGQEYCSTPPSSSSTSSGPSVFSLDSEISDGGSPDLRGFVNGKKKGRIANKIMAHLRKKNKPQSAPTTPLQSHRDQVLSIFKMSSDSLQAMKNADKNTPAHDKHSKASSKPNEINRNDNHQASTPGIIRRKAFGKSPLKPVFPEETNTASEYKAHEKSSFVHNVSISDGKSVGKPLHKVNTRHGSAKSNPPGRRRSQIASTIVVITAGLLMGRTFAIVSLVCYFYVNKIWPSIGKLSSA